MNDADIITHLLHRCAAGKNEKFDPIELINEKIRDESISIKTFERVKEILIQEKLLILYSDYCVCASSKTLAIEDMGGYGKYIAKKLADEDFRIKSERRKDQATKMAIAASIAALIASLINIGASLSQVLQR